MTDPQPSRIKVVETVECPRCRGEGTTGNGVRAYGDNIEWDAERCGRCAGRGVITAEVWRDAK